VENLSHLVGPIPQASMQAVNTVSGRPLFTAPGSDSESAPDPGEWQGTPIPAATGPTVLVDGDESPDPGPYTRPDGYGWKSAADSEYLPSSQAAGPFGEV
jgi:hypothetical protein